MTMMKKINSLYKKYKEIINYLFKECNYKIIEAIIPSDNIASIKVAEKCDMKLEAALKDRYKDKINGKICNLLIYSIFNND